jgi:hypothetical protein
MPTHLATNSIGASKSITQTTIYIIECLWCLGTPVPMGVIHHRMMSVSAASGESDCSIRYESENGFVEETLSFLDGGSAHCTHRRRMHRRQRQRPYASLLPPDCDSTPTLQRTGARELPRIGDTADRRRKCYSRVVNKCSICCHRLYRYDDCAGVGIDSGPLWIGDR